MKFKSALFSAFLISGSFSASVSAEQILQCMRPVNIDDPNFQQGSELFFDIYLDKEKGVKVVLTKGNYETEVFLEEGAEHAAYLDLNDRSFHAEWKDPASITLTLRQFSTRWVGGFWFSEGYKSKLVDILPGRDIDLSCIEKGSLRK